MCGWSSLAVSSTSRSNRSRERSEPKGLAPDLPAWPSFYFLRYGIGYTVPPPRNQPAPLRPREFLGGCLLKCRMDFFPVGVGIPRVLHHVDQDQFMHGVDVHACGI